MRTGIVLAVVALVTLAACDGAGNISFGFSFLDPVPEGEAPLPHRADGRLAGMIVEGHFVQPCQPYHVSGRADVDGRSLSVTVEGRFGDGCETNPDTVTLDYRATFVGLEKGEYGIRVTHRRFEPDETEEVVLDTTALVVR